MGKGMGEGGGAGVKIRGWEIFKVSLHSCPVWLNGWLRHIWCAILLNSKNGTTHAEPWYHSTRRTLMCVLCKKASSLLRLGTYCGFLLVLWLDITHKHSNTQHTQGGSRLTHTYKYKYLNHLLCARSSYLCYIKWLNE